jgi:hypothetical protein
MPELWVREMKKQENVALDIFWLPAMEKHERRQ